MTATLADYVTSQNKDIVSRLCSIDLCKECKHFFIEDHDDGTHLLCDNEDRQTFNCVILFKYYNEDLG